MTHVRWIGCVTALLLAVTGSAATAQPTADVYFHEAAQQYVAENLQAARQTVERGLKVAPSDPRLLALRKKLRKGKRPNRNQKQQDSMSTGSTDKKQKGTNRSSDDASKGGKKPSSEQSGSSQPGTRNSPSKQKGPHSSGQRSSAPPGRADTTRRGRGGRPVDTLSRSQAERLLRALEGQERRLLRQLRIRSSKRRTVEKDW